VILGLAVLACLALPGATLTVPTPFSTVGATLEQCQNQRSGIGDCTGAYWVTGNLNPNNSLYREGDFVPFRSALTSLVPGRSYSLRIGYDAVEKGLHAYDYLGSVDGSESAPGQQVVPCYGVAGTAGPHACGNGPSTLAVPKDTDTSFPGGSQQKPGEFSAWGATLTQAAYVNPAPIGANTPGTVARQIDVTFTAAGDTVVLAWGGHIASTLDWGAGRTFISAASGSSFHMRLLQIQQGGSIFSPGNRELSLQATALAPVPAPFTTQVDRSPVEVGSAVVDTATLAGRPGAPVTGEVNFFVCFGPAARPNCTVGGTQVGPGQVVVAPSLGSPDGVASVQFVPDQAGSYCFRAEYVPSAVAPYSPAAHTNTTTECFEAVITPPVLTVTKVCIPPDDPGHFNLLHNGDVVLANAACGDSAGVITTTPGVHTVSETAGTGTDLADYTSVIGGNCAADGSITLANGQAATCTITNTLNGTGIVPGTLTVNKVCSPANDGGLFDVHIDDSVLFADVPCGGSTGAVPLPAGAHAVREAGGTDTSLADYTTVIGGACASDGSVTVPAGGAVTCTITNTRNPIPAATLTVTKLCVPGSSDRFTIMIGDRPVGTVGCGGSVGPVDVTPGQHTVGETGAGDTDLSDYTVVQGGDCQADGTVFVAAGQHAECTITNTRRARPALLAVTKVCVPSDDGGRFNLTIDGQTSADQGCGERFGPLVVSPGVHHVSEAAGTGTNLSDYTTVIGGDCAADGSVTVAAGQSATCTITNVRNDENIDQSTAQITIIKRCRPAGVVTRFQLNLDQNVFQGVRCGASIGPILTSTGLHSVGEVAANAKPGLFRSIISGDCAASGAITLTAGQHATCIVTNVRRRVPASFRPPAACYRLTVSKRMVNLGRVRILAHVRLFRRPVQGVRVYAVGPGVFDVRTTNRRGQALFLLRLRRAGLLRMTIRKPFACPHPPPKRIGVLGASQTFLTG
jgi:hypothetical protein